MILKAEIYKADKKVNPLIGILLFLISVFLFVCTVPFGFVYGLLHGLFKKGMGGIGEYLLKVAISIDQLGNVAMQHPLNVLWIKKSGYKFGNRDETISSALGRNNKLGTLTTFGKFIDKFLDLIDKDHSLNSIDYYIEPSPEIMDMLAWVLLIDQKILAIRHRENRVFNIPSGIRDVGNSDAVVLFKILKEDLKIDIDIPSLQYIATFEAPSNGQKPHIMDRKTCYSGTYKGQLDIDIEIMEIRWLTYKDRGKVSKVDQLIFDFLKDSGQLA